MGTRGQGTDDDRGAHLPLARSLSFAGAKAGVDAAWRLPYRSDEEVRAWISRDPITRFKGWLVAKNLATANELTKVETDAQAAVDAAISFARDSKLPDPEAGVLNTHASGPVRATQFYNRSGLAGPRTT